MLQEDRDRQLDAERKRVIRYLQELNRLIRLERGVKARTDGGDDETELSDDQQRVGEDHKSSSRRSRTTKARRSRMKNDGKPDGESQQGEKPPSASRNRTGSEAQTCR